MSKTLDQAQALDELIILAKHAGVCESDLKDLELEIAINGNTFERFAPATAERADEANKALKEARVEFLVKWIENDIINGTLEAFKREKVKRP